MLTRDLSWTGRFVLLASCLWVLAGLLAGCGRGATDTPAEESQPAPPPIDPRVATADALLDHFNALNTASPISWWQTADLYYPESDLQHRLLQIQRDIGAAIELQDAVTEYFGREVIDEYHRQYERETGIKMPSSSQTESPPRSNQPARRTGQSGDYVLASFTDGHGKPHTLYLAQRENRWWISGYTLEYENTLSPEQLDHREQMARRIGRNSRLLLAKLRAGELATYEQYLIESARMMQPPE